MDKDRRQFLRNSGIVLSIAVAGEVLLLSPAQARAAGLPLQLLSAQEAATLEAITEAVVPGARKAGISQYIDKQLAASHEESLLMLKYLGVPQSDFLSFYQGGLRSAAALAHSRFGKNWSELASSEAASLVTEIAGTQPEGVGRAPGGVFLFCYPLGCQRCCVWHRGRLCRDWHALHGAHRAAGTLVTAVQPIPVEDPFDLLVVGSGAAGSVMAAQAARAGKRVLILEAGPARELSDLVSSQIWARRLKWSGAPVVEEGNLNIGHAFNSGWGSGGAAKHQYAVWPRLHENDFKTQTQYGKGIDWPFEYQDLQPYYDKIQAEVGLSGDAEAEKWRPPGEKYPMPPTPVFAQGRVIEKGFQALNMSAAPIPLAINSVPYKGRKACLYDGWCDAGCPIGALANPLVTYLAWAREAGAELRNQALVTRVIHDASGRKVTGVEYYDAAGKQHRVHGKAVVLAAFCVQNARLLLASASDKHPRGLANSNDLVGRFLMTHPANSVYGLFADETLPYQGPTGGQLINHDHYKEKLKGRAFGSYQWLIANALKPNDLLGIANTRPDIYGPALQEFMRKAAAHMGAMVFVGEDLPLAENRVTLSDKRDQYGVPLAKATHNITAATEALCEAAVAEGLAIFKAAGAAEPWAGPRFGMHILGGTIMGSSPEKSVTDSYGRCHELDNLYVAGSGLFPTSGAVNPTFTIHALTLRSADHILKNIP